ncbi:MAG: DUF3817 domain-containing protein [Verrucomicrobiota bacterium]
MCPVKTIHRLRVLGIIEGVSLLLLLGIAMPLKYGFDLPIAVKIVGWTHGLLFMGFVSLLLVAMILAGWSFKRGALCFAAAFFPFGPFLIDKRMRRYADEAAS